MDETRQHHDASRLVSLLKHQRTLYRRLRLLADRQNALVAQSDAQPLLELLADRQRLVDGLVGLSEKMAPYRRNWTSTYAMLDEPTRKVVAGLLEEANSALGSVLQSDNRDTATLAAKRQDFADRLTTAETGSRASAAYASAGAGASRPVTDAMV
jgi:chorismate-pyruvate lyase